MRVSAPAAEGDRRRAHGARLATPPFDGAPIQFVDVFPLTADRKVHLFPDELDRQAPGGLYGYQPDPATERYPLALISPASEKTVSSTLGELRKRAAMLQMHPLDATARGLSHDDPVRVFNDLGEVQCRWRSTRTSGRARCRSRRACGARAPTTARRPMRWCPDTLTDLGGGACFNDARVEVALLGRH